MAKRNLFGVVSPQNVGLPSGTGMYNTPAVTYGQSNTPPAYTPPPTTNPTSNNPSYQLPDFNALLANDPGLAQLRADLAAQGISDQAGAKAASQRAFVQFGEVPNDLSSQELGVVPTDYASYATPDVTAAAKGNQFSTQARLLLAHQQALQSLRGNLASRGLLHSGEYGYQMNKEQNLYNTGEYDSRAKLVDFLAGIQSALATGAQQRQNALAAGIGTAQSNALQLLMAQMQSGGYPTRQQTPDTGPAAPPPVAPSAPSAGGQFGAPSVSLVDALAAMQGRHAPPGGF
jgi:hypothetical protein